MFDIPTSNTFATGLQWRVEDMNEWRESFTLDLSAELYPRLPMNQTQLERNVCAVLPKVRIKLTSFGQRPLNAFSQCLKQFVSFRPVAQATV